MNKIFTSLILSAVLITTSCTRNLSSDVYTSSSTLSLTMEGKIVSARQITIKGSDSLDKNGMGIMAGGVTGGIAGSSVGGGSGKALAVAGGAIAGAALGALIQDELATDQGFEYIIKVDTSNLKSDYYEGSGAMRNAISSATTNGLVTVIQGTDAALSEGQEVYVIFSDKRTRVIAK